MKTIYQFHYGVWAALFIALMSSVSGKYNYRSSSSRSSDDSSSSRSSDDSFSSRSSQDLSSSRSSPDYSSSSSSSDDIHGGVQMGVPDHECDNAVWNTEIDWGFSSSYETMCERNEAQITPITPTEQAQPITECLDKDDIPRPRHVCMTEKIEYDDIPPRAGPHRPLWPTYGEYIYIPPQRWVHALEHGAAVFLYHPCADQNETKTLKNIARSCLRKHIITPYRPLGRDMPYAIVTYGCRLLMNNVNVTVAKDFVKQHALTAPESRVYKDGHYDRGLDIPADVVSIYEEKNADLCPAGLDWMTDKNGLQIAENMDLNGFNYGANNLDLDRP